MKENRITTTIWDMVLRIDQNPDMIASVHLSSRATRAVLSLIRTLILIQDSVVVDYILANALHPITTLCKLGQEGLISTVLTPPGSTGREDQGDKTIGLLAKQIASHSAGVYVWTVEAKDTCLQYIGSTYHQPYRFHNHVSEFSGKGKLSGMYKYVCEHQLHSSCIWNEVYSTLNFPLVRT